MKPQGKQDMMKLVLTEPLSTVFARYPVIADFFQNLRLSELDRSKPLMQALEVADEEVLAEFGVDREKILAELIEFLEVFGGRQGEELKVSSITVVGGRDKSGADELGAWTVSVGETVSIVGPTGSGKSRLLGDNECLADRDTPTGRLVLIDGIQPTAEMRFELEGRLVAQLSQNMNFVMDLTVREFLEMHAGSRLARDVEDTIHRCFESANRLAGEKFCWDTKVTQLSGGQSRALMIADTAHMSASPVVLIDEIENAGIDRRQAVDLLAREEKIVLISTHDPLLALSADKRIVVRNGGVVNIIETGEEEKRCLHEIERLDATLGRLRSSLRQGEEIKLDDVLLP